MAKNNMLAMVLAGGRGSRLKDLTNKVAKPAVAFGGKYKIIDFPLSNCANSGIDIVGKEGVAKPLSGIGYLPAAHHHQLCRIGCGYPCHTERLQSARVGGVCVLHGNRLRPRPGSVCRHP